MDAYFPLFVTGPARSGTTLLAHLLDAHPQVAIAADVFFPLYRAFRNAILGRADVSVINKSMWNADQPIQDYYFTDDRIKMMDCVQEASTCIPFIPNQREDLLEAIGHRAVHESPDVSKNIHLLRGNTFQDWFGLASRVVAESRPAQGLQWAGSKEVWNIEFFSALARDFPQARFVVLLRDPRAMIASMLGIAARDPSQAGHILSYARHWRKYVAFCSHYKSIDILKDRLHVLTYEQLVQDPVTTSEHLCNFLEIDFNEKMLDADSYQFAGSGKRWSANSSFDDQEGAIFSAGVERWRGVLEPQVAKFVEFICGYEMRMLGYKLDHPLQSQDSEVFDCFSSPIGEVNWRSDLQNVDQDYGCELLRRELLFGNCNLEDRELIRRTFLFEEVRQVLRSDSRLIDAA